MNSFLSNLNWRYATKKFDASASLSEQQRQALRDAMRLAPTSYGLQPVRVLEIQDPKLRAELQPACWGQPQIVDADSLFVITGLTELTQGHVDEYISRVAQTRGLDRSALKGFEDMLTANIPGRPDTLEWTARQGYVVLGFGLAAAAELGIDATPMEGFNADKVDEILGIKQKNLRSLVVVAFGKRSPEDATQHFKKVRLPEQVFFEVR